MISDNVLAAISFVISYIGLLFCFLHLLLSANEVFLDQRVHYGFILLGAILWPITAVVGVVCLLIYCAYESIVDTIEELNRLRYWNKLQKRKREQEQEKSKKLSNKSSN